jgi:adenosylcobinamide amidohydrolase
VGEDDTCEECTNHFKIKRIRDYVYKHGLCTHHVNPDWSEDVIEALKILKKNGITREEYEGVRLSCNTERKETKND